MTRPTRDNDRRGIWALLVASSLATNGCDLILGIEERRPARCEQDCLGGDCVLGRCQPVALMPEQALAEYRSIVVEPGPEGAIYYTRWRPNGRIYQTSKAAEKAPTTVTIAAAGGWVSEYAIDDGVIYFPNYTDSDADPARGVWSVPRGGGTATQLVVDSPGGNYTGTVQVIVDGSELFFASSYGRVAIAKTALSGGPVTPLWYLGDSAPYYEACGFMKIDEAWIYRGRCGTSAGILRFSRQGGAPEVLYDLVDTAEYPALLELHDGYLYWTAEDSILRRAPADGSGPVETLLADVWRDTLVHDGYLYAINADSRGIVRLPLDDLQSPEVVVSPGAELIGSLAADEVSLYWLMYDKGQIFRLAL